LVSTFKSHFSTPSLLSPNLQVDYNASPNSLGSQA
jgi:hypothetical protein